MTTNPKRVAAKFLNKRALQTALLPSKVRQQVNAELRTKGFDGHILFQRPGQILSVAFDALKKYDITMSRATTANDFLRESGTLRLDVEFINEADPFSPVPIGNSDFFLQYTRLDETGRYEVIGYLS